MVAALFCCRSGPYAALGCDVFDVERDARTFDLACPVVAHPPCRAWGKLRGFARPRPDERDLAVWALWVVRLCGGVLEHPASSRLWAWFGLRPGVRDEFGGLLTVVHQAAYGHRAPKLTGLYCVGCEVVPAVAWGQLPLGRVERMGRAERERMPVDLARELVRAASGVRRTEGV